MTLLSIDTTSQPPLQDSSSTIRHHHHQSAPPTTAHNNHLHNKLIPALDPVSKIEYKQIVNQVKLAIKEDAHPIRIGQGSSGSYFCRNTEGQILGVFKPKNEEPYGELNPKWTKWIHKNFCFCCFGRSCLLPNVGYLSEAGACLLDFYLGFGLVPLTYIIQLNSINFNYPRSLIRKHARDPQLLSLPYKIGSFQIFLKGFKDASLFLKMHPLPPIPPVGSIVYVMASDRQTTEPTPDRPPDPEVGIWSVNVYDSFLNQFQRLVILDYLMRNTDRGHDNWMIKFVNNRIQIAAIDHGLAFPFKHPDQWRSYPYGWLNLPIAKIPFLSTLRNYMRTLLKDPTWWLNTRTELYELFSIDEGFDGDIFEAQMALMRGQMYNLVQCLMSSGSPVDLWLMPPIIVVSHPLTPTVVSPARQTRGTIARLLGNRVANGLRIGSLRSSQFVYSPVVMSPTASQDVLYDDNHNDDDHLLDDQFHLAGEFSDDPWHTSPTSRTVPVFHHHADELDQVTNVIQTNPSYEYVDPHQRSRSLSRLEDGRSSLTQAHTQWSRDSRHQHPSNSGLENPDLDPNQYYSFQPSSSSFNTIDRSLQPVRYTAKQRFHDVKLANRSSLSLPNSSYPVDIEQGGMEWNDHRRYSYHQTGGRWIADDDDPVLSARMRAIWVHGKQKVRDGGSSLIQRARNVILEAKRKPWFDNW